MTTGGRGLTQDRIDRRTAGGASLISKTNAFGASISLKHDPERVVDSTLQREEKRKHVNVFAEMNVKNPHDEGTVAKSDHLADSPFADPKYLESDRRTVVPASRDR